MLLGMRDIHPGVNSTGNAAPRNTSYPPPHTHMFASRLGGISHGVFRGGRSLAEC